MPWRLQPGSSTATRGQLVPESPRQNDLPGTKRGDTLASIARLFKTTVASLRTWNPRWPGNQLLAGQRLTVFRADELDWPASTSLTRFPGSPCGRMPPRGGRVRLSSSRSISPAPQAALRSRSNRRRVIATETGDPLRNARVVVTLPANAPLVLTDGDGRFSFSSRRRAPTR